MTDKIFGFVQVAINPGEAEAFKQAVQVCMAAAKQDLAGTHAYEWFLSPDETECAVLEIYDGVAGLTHHGRTVGHAIPGVNAHATVDIEFAGAMAAELLAKYRARFPKVGFAGARSFGRLRAPAPGVASEWPCEKIFAIARFRIHPGQEAQFRALAEDCFTFVDATEPGTPGYEWFIQGNDCMTLDIYENAAALKAHLENAGPKMTKILSLVDSKVRMFGAVPAEMLPKLRPELGVTYCGPRWLGIL